MRWTRTRAAIAGAAVVLVVGALGIGAYAMTRSSEEHDHVELTAYQKAHLTGAALSNIAKGDPDAAGATQKDIAGRANESRGPASLAEESYQVRRATHVPDDNPVRRGMSESAQRAGESSAQPSARGAQIP